jgi:hypothetical protein
VAIATTAPAVVARAITQVGAAGGRAASAASSRASISRSTWAGSAWTANGCSASTAHRRSERRASLLPAVVRIAPASVNPAIMRAGDTGWVPGSRPPSTWRWVSTSRAWVSASVRAVSRPWVQLGQGVALGHEGGEPRSELGGELLGGRGQGGDRAEQPLLLQRQPAQLGADAALPPPLVLSPGRGWRQVAGVQPAGCGPLQDPG